jgi:hypothetical protein
MAVGCLMMIGADDRGACHIAEAVITEKPVAHYFRCKLSRVAGILGYFLSAAGADIQETKDGKLSEHPMCNRFFPLQRGRS